MSLRLRRAFWILSRVLLAAVVLGSASLLLGNAHLFPWPQRTIALGKIRANEGFGFFAKLPSPWPGFEFAAESGVLTEDGRPMVRVNENGMVRETGKGAFRVGRDRVLFSSSDGSDPLKNGRVYLLRLESALSPSALPLILGAGGLAALLFLRKKLFLLPAWTRRSLAEGSPEISTHAAAWGILALALAARAGFLWLNPDYTDELMSIRGTPYSDARDWLGMAKATAEGRGVDSTYRGMRALYPMFLANFFTWFGNSVAFAKGLQAMIGASSAALIFLILRRAMPLWPALAAALFFALDPRQITQVGKLMTEPFGLLLMLLSAWCLMIGGERRRLAMIFAAGAFLACSNLARPLTLFAFPIFFWLVVINAFIRETCRWRAALLHGTAFALGTVLCLAPWVIRERAVHGIWAISCNSSSALFAASTPEFGVWTAGVEDLAQKSGVPREVKARYDFFQERFRENLRKYPGFYASNVARSLGNAAQECTNVSPALAGAGFGALGIFCALARRRGRAHALPAFAAMIALLCVNDSWAAGFAIIGVAFTLWWRPFPGAVLLVTHFGGLLGSALFGNPDIQRVRLLIDWAEAGWTFSGLFAVAAAATALLVRAPFKTMLGLQPGTTRDEPDVSPASWLRWLACGFAIFLVVSTARLVVLTGFTPPPARAQHRISDEERAAFLQEFTSRFPAWQRLADPAFMAGPRGWKRPAFLEFGTLEPEVFQFPANVGFGRWGDLFQPRPHAHTSGIFRAASPPFTDPTWTEFAGEIPTPMRDTTCLLIGLTKVRPAIATYLEKSVEAVALIPAPDFKPDFARAIVAPVSPETQALLNAPQ